MVPLLAVPLIAFATDDQLGWRATALGLAGVALIISIPAFALLRNWPGDLGLLPYGVPPAVETRSFSISQTFRSRSFWLIVLGGSSLSTMIIATTHLVSYANSIGFSAGSGGLALSVYSGVSIPGALVGAYLGDRVPKYRLLGLFSTLQAAGLLGLVFADSLPVFFLLAAVMGLGLGGSSVLIVTLLADYFGTVAFGMILGFHSFLVGLSLFAILVLATIMVEVLDSYRLLYLIFACLTLAGAFCFLRAHAPQAQQPAEK